jgi:uncharacterized membrane protein YcaP (DUF421 family)
LARNGRGHPAAARRNRLSNHDVHEDLRLHGNISDIQEGSVAVLERNGHISVVRRKHHDAVV